MCDSSTLKVQVLWLFFLALTFNDKMKEVKFSRELDDGQEDSEAEESPSLCDLPLGEDSNKNMSGSKEADFPVSPDHDIFEFYTHFNTQTMRAAEDIMFQGELLPYRSPPPLEYNSRRGFLHRKSDSLSHLQPSPTVRFTRSSQSHDYAKLPRSSSARMVRAKSMPQPNNRPSADKCFGTAKPKWRLLMFGSLRTPTEMELKDIRNRQSRRVPTRWFPTHNAEEQVSADKRDEHKGSWRLLRALSCKGEANGVITDALGCIRHV